MSALSPTHSSSKNGVRWKRGQSDSFTNRSARNRCFKLSVLLWENHNRKPNVKNKTRSGASVANVSLRIGPSLKLWSIIEESYCEHLELLLGDFFSLKSNYKTYRMTSIAVERFP